MDIKIISRQVWKTGLIVLLIAGLIVTVYLVQTKKIFKSKAYMTDDIPAQLDLHKAFDITDADGNPLRCITGEDNRYVCYSRTRGVNINLNQEKLIEELQ